ncbi:MAG: lysophospholipid acyltransferase family protein [Kiritimatiellia bacterium]|nr:lysophospholipid acyltransferase family protein [Kiritimatiellia bacterium]
MKEIKLAHRLEYGIVRGVSAFFSFLPTGLALALVWLPARLVFLLRRKVRIRTRQRIRQALGVGKTDLEIDRIACRAFRNLTFTAVEGLRLSRLTKNWIDRHLNMDVVHMVQRELEKKRGLIVAVPHMGNWELAGIALQSRGVNVLTLVRRQKNPLMNDWINRLRTATGAEAIDTKSRQVGEVPRKLNGENKLLAILPDVRAKAGGLPIRYLGQDTIIPPGLAQFARAARVPILVAEVYRKGWTRHEWRITGRIEPDFEQSGEADALRLTQYVMDRFSESVRAHPADYFWFNKRWVLGVEEE